MTRRPKSPDMVRETSPLLPKTSHSRSHSSSTTSSQIGQVVEVTSWKQQLSLVTALTNCLFAGSVLIYSLWAPLFQSRLHYSQMQVNAISAAAEVGMYLPVPIFGYLCDQYGPDKLSALSAMFFGPGYALAALCYSEDWGFGAMVAAFGLVGMGTSSMYFSGVTTCAKTFTGRRGLALATPIAAFGLSSLWMTQVVSRFFMKDGVLQVEMAFWFFSVSLVAVGLLGSLALNIGRVPDEYEELTDEDELDAEKHRWINSNTRAFLKDRTMWWFAAGVFLVTGPGEAFINNMGTLIQTLRPFPTASVGPPVNLATHVSLIALTSTLARLLAGTVSDYLAPAAPTISLPPLSHQKSRATCSRMYILIIFSLLMFTGFLLVASSFVYANPTLFYLVSSSIGAGYGAVFCLAPTVVSVVWGTKNFGTNWGIVTMTPALGAAVFGSLFAAEYDGNAATGGDGSCVGWHCARWSFTIMAGSVVVAVLGWLWAWRGVGGWRSKEVVV